ncbi:CPBP family intramembrane glutamic endopeptidase [Paludisphaera rhizosphaerae]|uniref:CPBP family intramembrane glutamic endopeptidase n=1 Tax=Paludisphaera rhizosphaerae TaxID=2711216 RepID=UPI0013EAA0FF|nr:CPBP family intramembrane glutamic endopeptidase [Paludisphaera rhizosphaerae]
MQFPGTGGILFLAFLLLLLPLAAWRTSRRLRGGSAGSGPPVSRVLYWRSAVVTQLFLFVLAFMVGSTFHFSIFKAPPSGPTPWLWGIVALAVCLGIRQVGRWSRTEEERKKLAVYQRSPRTRVEAAWFIAAVVCASVAEEAAYRGVGWQLLSYSTGSVWASAGILSAAFALAHWNQGWKSGVTIAALAATFHGLVALTGTLVIAMIAHAAYDFVAGYLINRQARAYDREAETEPQQGEERGDER